MKIIKSLTFTALAVLAATLLFQTSITRADDQGKKCDHRPLKITFSKCVVSDTGPFGGHFEGTVNGDCGAGKFVFTYLSVIPGDDSATHRGLVWFAERPSRAGKRGRQPG